MKQDSYIQFIDDCKSYLVLHLGMSNQDAAEELYKLNVLSNYYYQVLSYDVRELSEEIICLCGMSSHAEYYPKHFTGKLVDFRDEMKKRIDLELKQSQNIENQECNN